MIALSRGARSVGLRVAGILIVVVAMHAPLHAQAAPPNQPVPASASQPAAAPERTPEYPHAANIPSELLRPRRPQAMILPSVPAESLESVASDTRSGGVIGEVTPTERLLPEGYVLGRRPARFGRDGAWWAIAIGEVPGLPVAPALRVLPNRRLMLLERVLAEGKPEDTYLVTARVTEFLGRNYVLLEQVVSPPEHQPATANESAARETSGSATATSKPARPPSASEIIEQLMQDTPARAVTPPPSSAPAPGSAEAAGRSGEGTRRVQPEGTVVPEFPARLVRSEPWWTLARESQGSRPAGPPYYVLPNRLLEVMVSASAGGTRSMVFLVSGELTEYRGINYLLVHKVLIRRDTGNLR